jgi:hypothetical protein
VNVFLSASVPLPSRDRRFYETADVVAIREAVKGLVLVLLERNAHLTFGGHPAITPLIRLLFREARKPVRDHVTLYLSAYFEPEFISENQAFEDVVLVDRVNNDRERSLLEMRRRMLTDRPVDCAVFIGGMEGVLDEFQLVIRYHPKVCVLPVATTGAAAAIIFRQHPDLPQSLQTELTYPTLFRTLLPPAELGLSRE